MRFLTSMLADETQRRSGDKFSPCQTIAWLPKKCREKKRRISEKKRLGVLLGPSL